MVLRECARNRIECQGLALGGLWNEFGHGWRRKGHGIFGLLHLPSNLRISIAVLLQSPEVFLCLSNAVIVGFEIFEIIVNPVNSNVSSCPPLCSNRVPLREKGGGEVGGKGVCNKQDPEG